jgi:hemerythrin-like domain-containing protein
MQFSRRTAQLLHDDHRATLAMIENLEDLIARAKRTLPDVGDAATRKTLEQAATGIEQEVRDHFAFEENELFTRLADMGDADIGEHLRDEHNAILPIGEQVSALARAALEGGFTDQSWSQFRASTGELIERMLAHIQKEEMALLPVLDDLLDAETDLELSTAYGGSF